MKIFAAAVAASLALPAQSMVLDFDEGPVDWNGNRSEWAEDGFNFQNSLEYLEGWWLNLHDDSGETTSSFTRSDGLRFNMHGADLRGVSLLYEVVAADIYKALPVYYSLTGFREGQLVASVLQQVPVFEFSAQTWGNLFSNLDRFTISLLIPGGVSYMYGSSTPGDLVCSDSWCGGLQVDNLEYSLIAPVPLPASLPLLLAGLGGLGLIVRHRKR